MKLQFDAQQDFQLAAIQATVGLFAGQPDASQLPVAMGDATPSSLQFNEQGVANRRVITPEQWLENLHAVQAQQNLSADEALAGLQDDKGEMIGAFPNFTVEMETGTGKTYVYLRSIHELHRRYGFCKFVIVVPSVAIREGVLKSLDITRAHFQTLYDFGRVEHSVYDSARVNQLRNFALSDALQILVINIDAFAKDSDESSGGKRRGNVINQRRETGLRPIEFIQATNPIVLLDEPQNMETDKRKKAIARLNPLCTLRYSATHRDSYNLIYKLDPLRAYELGLVKQISVDSVIDLSSRNQAFIEVESFKTGARSIAAKATIWVNQAGGPKKKRLSLKNGDDLFALSNQREIYREGFIVNEIDAGEGFVRFANDVTARIGVPHGNLGETILKLQIEATVRRHFEKARKLEPQGIKVLSVFFIDRVASYRVYQPDGPPSLGPFGHWFEDCYRRYAAMPEYADLYDFEVAQVHNGYFAQDKRAVSPYGEADCKTKAAAESGAFELIMRDKERLLDRAEPLRFIFSHSALREGWDNPNVFQICTLAETRSEIKKSQEIGRGLRLCVNQDGQRVFDRAINRLTVIANEAYEDFANQLQGEMEEAGLAFDRTRMVQDERAKVAVRLRKGYQSDPAFLELWQRIQQRTRYRVQYDTAELIQQAAQRIRQHMRPIERPKIALSRADIEIGKRGVSGRQTGYRTQTVDACFQMPDFVSQIQSRTGLGKSTVARILLQAERMSDALNNPQLFIEQCAEEINAIKRELLVGGVEYLKLDGQVYALQRFASDELRELFACNVQGVGKPEKTLFSHIVIDANSGPERAFAQACEENDDVSFYIKLPRWFEIDTPVGKYNPDWALSYRNYKTLYFVAETKGGTDAVGIREDLLRPLEQLKIECGRRHFKQFEQVSFRVVKCLDELLN